MSEELGEKVLQWAYELDKWDTFILGMLTALFILALVSLAIPPEGLSCSGEAAFCA